MKKIHVPFKGKKLQYNAPVILTFVFACFLLCLIDTVFGHGLRNSLFCVYGSPLTDVGTWFRFFLHVLGHVNWDHMIGNLLYILILGPLLEEKYGSMTILFIMVITALVTGLFAFLFTPASMTMGASGIVFALILLASFTEFREDSIPVTFILVAVFYICQQVAGMFGGESGVAYGVHFVGGTLGGILGYLLNKKKIKAAE